MKCVHFFSLQSSIYDSCQLCPVFFVCSSVWLNHLILTHRLFPLNPNAATFSVSLFYLSSALFFLGHTIVIVCQIKNGSVIVWTCEGCIWNQVNTTLRLSFQKLFEKQCKDMENICQYSPCIM